MNQPPSPAFSNYPRPRPAQIDFGVIGQAFQIVFKAPGPFALAALLTMIGVSVPVIAVYVLNVGLMFEAALVEGRDPAASLMAMAVFYGWLFFASIVGYVLAGPATMSTTHMALRAASGQTVTMDDVFHGFRIFGRSCATGLLTMLVTYLGMLGCLVGMYVTGGLMMLAYALVLDQGLRPTEAVARSWAMMRPHWFMAAVLYLVLAFIAGAGVYACLVGVLFTWPVLPVAGALVYRDLRSAEAEAGRTPAPRPVDSS